VSTAPGFRSALASTVQALALPAVMVAGAIAIEHSHREAIQTELQVTADIAASAGALRLDGTSAGVHEAVAAAHRAAARNTAGGKAVLLSDDDIATGFWDEAAGGFVESTAAAEIDALRVRTRRGDLPSDFASVAIGHPEVVSTLR